MTNQIDDIKNDETISQDTFQGLVYLIFFILLPASFLLIFVGGLVLGVDSTSDILSPNFFIFAIFWFFISLITWLILFYVFYFLCILLAVFIASLIVVMIKMLQYFLKFCQRYVSSQK